MKIYKKYDTEKNLYYNTIAKNYIIKNKIKCKYYAFLGMSADKDLVKIDGKIYYFDIETQELKRRYTLISYSITDY